METVMLNTYIVTPLLILIAGYFPNTGNSRFWDDSLNHYRKEQQNR